MEPTIKTDKYSLYLGDCLEILPHLPGIDAVVTDPPYGTTACAWDSVIPFAPMWEQLKRITKPRGAIVLFGSQPFTSALIMSNPQMFKYEWIWDKRSPTGYLNCKVRPMLQHEGVLVFSEGAHLYNPQRRADVGKLFGKSGDRQNKVYGQAGQDIKEGVGYPLTILQFAKPNNLSGGGMHPTQKPVALMEYLIKTYTNEGETVLDFTMGSGTTGVACMNLGRKFIGIELVPEYFEIAAKRIEAAAAQGRLFEADEQRHNQSLHADNLQLWATP